MHALYKDFAKDSKDLLTKNFSAPGDWKIENKAKAPKGSYAIGTNSNVRGDVSIDVEGLTADGACYGKLTLTPKELQDVKATLRVENWQGQRVEGIVSQKGQPLKNVTVEVNHETVKPLMNGRLRLNDKVTEKAVELGLSLAAMDGVQVGCGATYDFKSHHSSWSVACRAVTKANTTVTLQTDALRSLNAGVFATLPLHSKFQPRVAANVSFDIPSNTWDGAVGAEWGCRVILGNTAKARVNAKLEWMVSYVAALKDGWALTLSFDRQMKAGVTLTRN
ncbi:putative voltage-dependent anion-selective channel [Leptomonas seymouri]|uniref:Putative voltage-dependent anion-selective channel n=1 Tax=Leptomonas seymouri TaxID=5684 RepID=A0A0N1IIR1_LEPSE|nr:putative voltage-dependent anion-selective channel [Leptomonas seymouri]|eukprot:KPI84982.1 putative voltage-dependent anion-selective channel [Leptomonas seymouri]